MRIKTDENLHPNVAAFLREHGHDAVTIWDQKLQGRPDPEIAEICRLENRLLITLDLDFSDIRAYPPEDYPGLIVLRLAKHSRKHVLKVFQRMFPSIADKALAGRFWIMDEWSIRVYEAGPEVEERS